MVRRVILRTAAAALSVLALAPAAGAATTTQLVLSQSAAFSILGHSCGGIQEQVYATGFATNGYPAGDVYMQTKCGGSGRGGGYKTTTYSAWATVTWDWFANTRSYARLEGAAEGISTTFSAEDAHGDRIYNVGTSAYLETSEPPLVPPGAPTAVTAEFSPIEVGEEEEPELRFVVSWTPAPETAGLITSSTVTATPVGSTAPVLTTTVSGPPTSALIAPLRRHTTYRITVTNSDDEGTSQASTATEAFSEGTPPPPPSVETCEQNQGTIKLSPGLEETPHVQSITIKGRLRGCDGSKDVTEATYVAHLKTTEEVTCSTLMSASDEPTTTPVSLLVKWAQAGISKGALVMPVSEFPGTGLGGTLEGGPLGEPLSIFAASVSESFTGGASCGVSSTKKKARAVKFGVFTTTQVEIGG
jgi:Fibronectin type III domain